MDLAAAEEPAGAQLPADVKDTNCRGYAIRGIRMSGSRAPGASGLGVKGLGLRAFRV